MATLLGLVCDGELGNACGTDPFHLSRQLAHLGEEFPSLKEEMLQRYQRLNRGRAKSIIESALIELADPPVIRALLHGYVVDHRPYDGGLSQALRSVALGRRPVEGWIANAYEEFSVSLAEFRQELFGMALANNEQSRLAERCLVEMEELRDEHGRVDDDPPLFPGHLGRSGARCRKTMECKSFDNCVSEIMGLTLTPPLLEWSLRVLAVGCGKARDTTQTRAAHPV